MEKDYTDEELEIKFKEILEYYKSMYSPTENPKVVLLGGQPGAGKSGLENMVNIKKNYVSISGDDYSCLLYTSVFLENIKKILFFS